jgi:hypothetical protein
MTPKTATNRKPPIPNRSGLRPAGPGLFESLLITAESPPPKTAHQFLLVRRDLGTATASPYNLQSAIGRSGSRLGSLHVGGKFVHQWPRRFRNRKFAAEDLMTVYIVAAHGPVSTAFEVPIFFSPASN